MGSSRDEGIAGVENEWSRCAMLITFLATILIGAILSAALMLETLGRRDESARIERAVEAAVQAGEVTQDAGGSLGTTQAGEAIRKRL